MNTIIQDEDSQRNGVVITILNVGPDRMGLEQVPFIRIIHRIREAVPIRLMGAHYCYDDPIIYSLMFVVTMFLGKRLRPRFKAHYGTIYCQVELTVLRFFFDICRLCLS